MMTEVDATGPERRRPHRIEADDRTRAELRAGAGRRSPAPGSTAGDDAPPGAGGGKGLGALHEAALRALNFGVALAGLVMASPLLLAIAVAIKLDSRGPVLYRQLRVGRDRRQQQGPEIVDAGGRNRRTDDLGGRPFAIYKFRTMHEDAEAATGPTWSSPGDDRTTRVGHLLRRHRLDELPQLWNVLKGDMAIVGPRPERPLIFQRLREQIGGYTRRQDVRPGITGWAQINRASDQSISDVEQKLRYDLEYVEKRSLAFDARVMMTTPLVMARPDLAEGAADDAGRREDPVRSPATARFTPPRP
ncbi:MAG: sugar transferase [Gemmatimonadota bacterium]